MCKSRIESVERLRRYMPYKLMNIASPYKKFHILFFKFSFFFQFSIKIKLLLYSSRILSFHIQEENWISWGVAEIQAAQIHECCKSTVYKKFQFIFFEVFSFFQFSREKNNPAYPRCTALIFGLSICKRRIEFVDSLRKYRPYKLMLKSVDTRTDGRILKIVTHWKINKW